MIYWPSYPKPYPQWQAGQMANQSSQYTLYGTNFGQTLPAPLPGDDDGDYFYTITNW